MAEYEARQAAKWRAKVSLHGIYAPHYGILFDMLAHTAPLARLEHECKCQIKSTALRTAIAAATIIYTAAQTEK